MKARHTDSFLPVWFIIIVTVVDGEEEVSVVWVVGCVCMCRCARYV